MGALKGVVVVQLFVLGLYLPPVFKKLSLPSIPPQTIISVPVQTAPWPDRPTGTLVVLVETQLFVLGLYRPPVSTSPVGASLVLVAAQLFVLGLYLPPVLKEIEKSGRSIWIVDAHRDDGKRFIVRADEMRTAFVELQRAIHEFAVTLLS